MDWAQALVLSIIQGLTEYLPISSSAHLILAPRLFGFADQGLAFDVAVHLGSLFAVLIYFRREVNAITRAWFASLPGSATATADSRLGWAIIIGTIPVVIVGGLMKGIVETEFRSPLIIAIATIVFGLLLWWADVRAKRVRDEYSVSIKDALIIGCFQVLALIPGTSRSGITITAGLMLGLTRKGASRFSFLLAIPTILMSSMLVIKDLIETDNYVDWNALLMGVMFSWVSAYACIYLFLKMIERIGMLPFVIYRLLLGGLIFVLLYG